MKPEDIVKKIKFVAVLSIILIIGIFLPTNKIEAATEKYSETINGISWTVSIDGNGYVYIAPSNKTEISGEVTIPSTVAGYTVNAIKGSAFQSCKNLTEIIMPSGITEIGSRAFEYCGKLEKVSIPEGVTSIGDYAFSHCTSLIELNIPASVVTLGYYMVGECGQLLSIEVDKNNKEYTSVDGVVFSKNMEKLVFFPAGKVGIYKIPEGVKALEECAFDNSKLSGISIPNTLESIGYACFWKSENLENIEIDEGNLIYCTLDGVLFTKDMKKLIVYPSGKVGNYSIPNHTEIIGDYAFSSSQITGINIPNSVTILGNYAFARCHHIQEINIPSSVNDIGRCAFEYCKELISINVDDENEKYSSIEGVLFDKLQCTILRYPDAKEGSYKIPDSVFTIGPSAFSFINLNNLYIPKNVEIVESYAFYGCENSMNVYYYRTYNSLSDSSINNLKTYNNANLYFMEILITENPKNDEYINNIDNINALTVNHSIGTDLLGNVAGEISYQWYLNETDSNIDGTPILGATESTYTPQVMENGTRYYYCIVTNTCKEAIYVVTSEVAEIKVERSNYNVTFESNCADLIPTQSVFFGDKIEKPEELFREGYIFEGWYTDATFTEIYDFTNPVTANLNLYAKWSLDYSVLQTAVDHAEANLVNAEFIAQHSDMSLQIYQWIYLQAKTMLMTKSATTSEEIKNSATSLTNMEQLLTVRMFNVIFESNGGAEIAAQKIAYKEVVMEPEEPNRTGYLFGGWYTDNGFTEQYDFALPVEMDITLYAKWDVDYKRLPEAVAYAESISSDIVFLAPYTEASINEYREILEQAEIMLTEKNADSAEMLAALIEKLENPEQTLVKKVFSIVFVNNEETYMEQSITYGEKIIEPEPPSREGYLFEGWYTDETFAKKYVFSAEVKEQVVLYALWAIDYSELEEAVKHAEVNLASETFKAPFTEDSIQNYYMKYTQAESILRSQSAETKEEVEKAKEELLEAEEKLEKRILYVIFESNYGTLVSKQDIIYGEKVSEPEIPYREKYIFAGWFKDESFTEKYDFSANVTKNIILYAKWDVDYSELEKAISVARGKLMDKEFILPYTQDSIQNYHTILEKAEEMLNCKTATTAEEVESMKNDLEKAEEGLVIATLIVSFESNGGNEISEQKVKFGELVQEPEPPSRKGYNFAGWYTDETYTVLYDFETAVKTNITVYAKWNVDYVGLENAVAHAGTKLEDEEFLLQYTEVSIEAYQKIYDEACRMLENQEADSIEEVNKKIAELEEAEGQLKIKEFYVTFDCNGGTELASKLVQYNGKVVQEEEPVYAGYIFEDWCIDEACTQVFDFSTPITANITLYAKWVLDYSELEDAVQIAKDNLSNEEFTDMYTSETLEMYQMAVEDAEIALEARSAKTPAKIKYYINMMANNQKMLELKTFIVTFESNGGTEVSESKVQYGETIGEPNAPVYADYIFDGWYRDKQCTQKYDFTLPIKSDITVYAKWNVDYTDLYTAIQYAEGVLLDAEQLEPYMEESVNTYRMTLEQAQQMYNEQSATIAEETKRLIAILNSPEKVFIKKVFEVTFISDDSVLMIEKDIIYGEMVKEPEKPSRDGYLFDGWFTDEQFNNKYIFSSGVKSQLILYAKWSLDYSELESAIRNAEQNLSNDEFRAPYTEESLQNYQLKLDEINAKVGNATSIEDIENAIVALKNAEKELDPKPCYVTFESNGGTEVSQQKILYGESVVEPAEPTRDGYIFNNWYADQELTKLYDFSSPVKDNITLYAGWEIDYSELQEVIYSAKIKNKDKNFLAPYTEDTKNAYLKALNDATYMNSMETAETPEDIDEVIRRLEEAEKAFKKKEFDVMFESYDGIIISKQSVEYGTCVAIPEKPSREGYEFVDWYTDEMYEVQYNFNAVVTDNMILYAKWKIDYSVLEEAIQYAENLLVDEEITQMYTEESIQEYRNQLESANTILSSDGNITLEEINVMVARLKNPEETLVRKEFLVTFECNGGTLIPIQEVQYGKEVQRPEEPSREGYEFVGWYQDQAYVELYDFTQIVRDNLILYAKWNVDYSALQAVIDVASANMENNEFRESYTTETVMVYQEVLDEAIILNNNRDAASAEEVCSLIQKLEDADSILDPKKYMVTFESNGGTEIDAVQIVHGKCITESIITTKDGYIVEGWYSDEAFKEAYDFSSPVKADITLYVKWELDYSILQNAVNNANEIIADENFEAKYPEMICYLYKKALQDSEKMLTNRTADSVTDIQEQVAKLETWKEFLEQNIKTFQVIFESNGGSEIVSQTVTYGSYVNEVDDPIYTGYEFIGWYTDLECNNPYDFLEPVKADMTLYAKWIEVSEQTSEIIADEMV